MATSLPEYIYRSASDLDSYPYLAAHGLYGGGGYVFELRGPLRSMLMRAEQLNKEGWIDKYTRAVFVEFTVYNAQVTYTRNSTSISHNIFTIYRKTHVHYGLSVLGELVWNSYHGIWIVDKWWLLAHI